MYLLSASLMYAKRSAATATSISRSPTSPIPSPRASSSRSRTRWVMCRRAAVRSRIPGNVVAQRCWCETTRRHTAARRCRDMRRRRPGTAGRCSRTTSRRSSISIRYSPSASSERPRDYLSKTKPLTVLVGHPLPGTRTPTRSHERCRAAGLPSTAQHLPPIRPTC